MAALAVDAGAPAAAACSVTVKTLAESATAYTYPFLGGGAGRQITFTLNYSYTVTTGGNCGSGTRTVTVTPAAAGGTFSGGNAGAGANAGTLCSVSFAMNTAVGSYSTGALTCTVTWTEPSSPAASYTITSSADSSGTDFDIASASPTVTFNRAAGPTYSLSVTKTAQSATYDDDDDTVTFDVTITNTSTNSATDITITSLTDQINGTGPKNNLLNLSNGSKLSTTCNTINLTLALGASRNCTVTYELQNNDYGDGKSVSNVVFVEGSYSGGTVAETQNVTPAVTSYNGATSGAYSLNLDKTIVGGLTTYNDVTVSVAYKIVITNTSSGNAPINQIQILDSLANPTDITSTCTGWANPGAFKIGPGVTITCLFSYALQPADKVHGKVLVNTASVFGRRGNQQITASDEVSIAYLDVVGEIGLTTNSFILHRMDRIISDDPRETTLAARRENSMPQVSGTTSELGYTTTIAASTRSMAAYAALKGIKAEGKELLAESVGPPSQFSVWVRGTFSHYSDNTGGYSRGGDFTLGYLGADWLVNDRLLVGVLLQGDSATEESSTKESLVYGSGWMVGPYASVELLPNVFFNVRGAWGKSTNHVEQMLGGSAWSGDFDTTRWLARASLTGEWRIDQMRISPMISVAYMAEDKDSFLVSDGIDVIGIPSAHLALGRVSVGPEVSYTLLYGGMSFIPFTSVKILWDYTVNGNLVLDGLQAYDAGVRGAVELGIRFRENTSGAQAGVSVSYDGIGADSFHAISARGSLRVPF